MAHNPDSPSSVLFSQVDVAHSAPQVVAGRSDVSTHLLQSILSTLQRQTQLLEELVSALGAQQRQRAAELHQWRQNNPQLARACRRAAETLSGVQAQFLRRLTDDVQDSADALLDAEFVLSEFVDRYGPRLAHLHSVLQVLSQLSAPSGATESAP